MLAGGVPAVSNVKMPKFIAAGLVTAPEVGKVPVAEGIVLTVNVRPVAAGIWADNCIVDCAIAAWPNRSRPPKIKLNLVFIIFPFLILRSFASKARDDSDVTSESLLV
jgi:hypothetical protein